MAARERSALLVLGMHRSGTSALARVLNLLGADLGPSLLPANADNESGFWEPRELVAVHDELLAALGTSWHDPWPLPAGALEGSEVRPFRERILAILRRDFAAAPLVGLKDPRLCRLLPLWRPLLEEAGLRAAFVLIRRHPDDVAASLAARNGMSRAAARLLWLDHVLASERDSRGAPRAFLSYEGLLEDWRTEVRRVATSVGMPDVAAVEKAAGSIGSFLDRDLRHQRGGGEALPAPLAEVLAAWEKARAGEDAAADFDALARRADDARALYRPWVEELHARAAQDRRTIESRGARIAKLEARLAARDAAPTASLPAPALPDREGSRVLRACAALEGAPRVSIVIPLFNQAELTVRCLESLAAHTEEGTYEVILVDNASRDGTRDLLEGLSGNVKIVANERNLGFAAACNQGAALAATPNLLFLNNDVEALPGWLPPLLAVLEADPAAGVVGSKLLFPDGRLQHAGVALLRRANASTPLGAFHMHYGEPADFPPANRRCELQVVTGACLLVRKRAFDDAGRFDEFFWNGCEDVDLCLKLRERGWRVVYEPASVLVHHESRSGPERWSRTRANEELLASRWFGRVEPDLVEEADGSRRRTEAGCIRDWVPGVLPAADGTAAPPDARTSIVILARNQLEHTRRCVASIERHTPEPHELILVDNGSTDGTREYLEGLVGAREHVRVVANAANRGFAAGNNQALALARGRRIVLLNNDTIVTEGWLSALLDVLEAHPEAGLVGAVTNRASGPQVLPDATYRTVAEMEAFAARRAAEHEGRSVAARRIVAFCWAMRREVVDALGGFDESFGTGNCEDDDYCLRAHQHGWKTRIALGAFVHHAGSRTFAGEGIDYRASLARNFEIFKAKWGMDPAAPLDRPYPFEELVSSERRQRIPLPSPEHTHEVRRGGRWLEERRARAAGAPAAETLPAAKAAATSLRLSIGVVGTDEPGRGPRELLARHGHPGAMPRWASAAEVADRLRQGGHVLLLGPDVVVPDDALQELAAVAMSDPRLAALGPLARVAPLPQRGGPVLRNVAEADRVARKRRARDAGRWQEVPYLGAFCLLLDADAAQRAGGLDASLPLADALFDLFARLREAGSLVACARGAWVHHVRLDEAEGRDYDARGAAPVAVR
jgi:GT2 family glycosyltransferase